MLKKTEGMEDSFSIFSHWFQSWTNASWPQLAMTSLSSSRQFDRHEKGARREVCDSVLGKTERINLVHLTLWNLKSAQPSPPGGYSFLRRTLQQTSLFYRLVRRMLKKTEGMEDSFSIFSHWFQSWTNASWPQLAMTSLSSSRQFDRHEKGARREVYIYYNYTIIIRMGTIQMLGMPIYVLFCQGDGLTLADLDPCLMHCFCIGASRLDLGLGC